MSEITRLLDSAAAGDQWVAAQILPLVYDELRKLAAAKMSTEDPSHTLSATALVHEAYLRLMGDQQFENRSHFFSAAATAMRRILIDRARAKRRQKRGGEQQRHELHSDVFAAPEPDEDLLALDAALSKLAEH